ncbi:ferrous iron transport protein A [bacterium]|nr:ferrous iron transport protein A [bacterium]
MKKLWDLREKSEAVIRSLDSSIISSQYQRLVELGIRDGESVVCLKVSPFGGPRVYQVCGSVFSIARDVASRISIDEAQPNSFSGLVANV